MGQSERKRRVFTATWIENLSYFIFLFCAQLCEMWCEMQCSNWKAPSKRGVCTYFVAIVQVAWNPLKFGMPILFVLKNVPELFFQEGRKIWTKLQKSQHAKFQRIPSNLKNHNEIGTYASINGALQLLYDKLLDPT